VEIVSGASIHWRINRVKVEELQTSEIEHGHAREVVHKIS